MPATGSWKVLAPVYVSSAVRVMLLAGDQHVSDVGEHELKGLEGTWRVYALVP